MQSDMRRMALCNACGGCNYMYFPGNNIKYLRILIAFACNCFTCLYRPMHIDLHYTMYSKRKCDITQKVTKDNNDSSLKAHLASLATVTCSQGRRGVGVEALGQGRLHLGPAV